MEKTWKNSEGIMGSNCNLPSNRQIVIKYINKALTWAFDACIRTKTSQNIRWRNRTSPNISITDTFTRDVGTISPWVVALMYFCSLMYKLHVRKSPITSILKTIWVPGQSTFRHSLRQFRTSDRHWCLHKKLNCSCQMLRHLAHHTSETTTCLSWLLKK